jgi:hypothetical protein
VNYDTIVLFEIVESEGEQYAFADCHHDRGWYGPDERAQAVFRNRHQIVEVDRRGGFQPTLRADDDFCWNTTDGCCDWGNRDVMKMANDILPGEDEHGATVVGAGKAKLPNFPSIYFGHDCAFRTGANSLRLTGWRA